MFWIEFSVVISNAGLVTKLLCIILNCMLNYKTHKGKQTSIKKDIEMRFIKKTKVSSEVSNA